MTRVATDTPQRDPLRVMISGGALSGNKGAMAMTLVAIEQIRRIVPGCRVQLLSKYPWQDAERARELGVELMAAPPKQLVTVTLIRSALCRLLHCRPVGPLNDSILRAYRQADVLVDLGGDTFTEDRDWRGLLLSVGWLLPGVAAGTRMVKLSQAIGPFRRFTNRFWAKYLLPKCAALHARGEKTRSMLHELLGSRVEVPVCADVAFLLAPDGEQQVDAVLARDGIPPSGFVGVSVSAVVDRNASRVVPGYYRTTIARLVEHIRRNTGRPVLLISHATPQGKTASEDAAICHDIRKSLGNASDIHVLQDDLPAALLKGVIQRADAMAACRFHAMVAALGTSVPVMVMGWGHKYGEVMDMFGVGQFTHDFAPMTVTDAELCASFDRLWEGRTEIRRQLAERHEGVVQSAQNNFRRLRSLLEQEGLL